MANILRTQIDSHAANPALIRSLIITLTLTQVRLSREIDKRARLAFLVDYVFAITTISLMPKTQARPTRVEPATTRQT